MRPSTSRCQGSWPTTPPRPWWAGGWSPSPAGLIVGDVLVTPLQQRRLIAPAAIAAFLPYLAFAFDPPVSVAMPLLVGSGVCGLYALGLDARVRDAAPGGLFARTMTLNSAGLMTLQGIGFTSQER